MDIDAWFSNFEEIKVKALKTPAACAFVTYAKDHATDIVEITSAYRWSVAEGGCIEQATFEFVVFEFRTMCPQRSEYPIKQKELLAVRFGGEVEMPLVYVLRSDFPDTAHQLLAMEGCPRAICIDDRGWEEACLTWTAAELVHRILSWFKRAARGELHEIRQPLDPVMLLSSHKFIIYRDDLAYAEKLDLVGIVSSSDERTLMVMQRANVIKDVNEFAPLCVVAYCVKPTHMRRMRFAPTNLISLADMLLEQGIELLKDLRANCKKWLTQKPPEAWRINGNLAIIIQMPIIAPDDASRNGEDLRAFVVTKSVGEIAEALGMAGKVEKDVKSATGYTLLALENKEDMAILQGISVLSAEVHYAYDRQLATQLSGREDIDPRKVVLVGAGTIGSHLADCLSREGRFEWTVIDHDRLLPHNLARHIGRISDTTAEKATLVANAVSNQLKSVKPIAQHIIADVNTKGKERGRIKEALNKAALIIDASASVPTGRLLSDHPSKARRASVFFNPRGFAGVLLVESEDRSLTPTLRDLEAKWFSLVARDERMANLLASPEEKFVYFGACRAITNRMPQSNVIALSGLIAHGLGSAVDQPQAVMKTWILNPSGEVEFIESPCEAFKCFEANKWKIFVDRCLVRRLRSMRDERLPCETGGVLTGVVDIRSKCIHLCDAASAPEGSVETPGSFVRGTAGVKEYLEEVFERTSGQIRYVGEWHSHPRNATTQPSQTDLRQYDWLCTLFDIEKLPTLMLIVGDVDVTVLLANQKAIKKKIGKSRSKT